jgi:hypothetical protein
LIGFCISGAVFPDGVVGTEVAYGVVVCVGEGITLVTVGVTVKTVGDLVMVGGPIT